MPDSTQCLEEKYTLVQAHKYSHADQLILIALFRWCQTEPWLIASHLRRVNSESRRYPTEVGRDVTGELPKRVVSRRLAKSYIRISCTSEFGATTDIRLTPGMDM